MTETWGLPELIAQLKRIADRLDGWDRYYRTKDGRETHSIATTTTIFEVPRREQPKQ